MEKILVVPAKRLPSFQGFMDADDKVIEKIRKYGFFVDRDMAENDFSLKQIIPYVTFMHNGRIFTMRRLKKGGEVRLHDKMSIGIGGHINHADEEPLEDGLRREFFEEVEYKGVFEPVLFGFINDDSDDVGRVHFGVSCYVIGDSGISVKEEHMLEGEMKRHEEIDREQLETWSRIVLENLMKSIQINDV
ncbi:MAG: NUDIX hydrolase [Candidatus Aenigmarchaeota archaeon]|nr:NUDIX hydrolase [Candidatus Aenigmarchaeota archaeon]MDI6722592.1 NUDIX hydrolase [Candidatus Aenigmarchaeota archaeon]